MADTFCYVAMHVGKPGAYAACADLPEYQADTAKFVAAEIKNGAQIYRVKTEEARRLLGIYIRWKDRQKPKKRRRASTATEGKR